MSRLPEAYRDDLRSAVDTLRRGGVIIYPTDTIWGIGCDARDSAAVHRIYDIKRRADSKALITLVDSMPMLERAIDGEIPDAAEQLIDVAVSPLTIIYDKGRGVAPELLADDGSIAIRLTREPFSAALCRGLGAPVVSTSANISGCPAPAIFADIDQAVLAAADYVCLSRRDEGIPASPSSIIKVGAGGLIRIIR